jgi:CheY-like chemotaxis protein
MNVLLVEDDDLVRLCLAEGLEEAGLRVAEVADAEQALARLDAAALPPAVLVTDLALGRGLDGAALIAAARHRYPRLRAVLISGADVTGLRLDPGDRFLPKPLRLDALVRVVENLALAGQAGPGQALDAAAG